MPRKDYKPNPHYVPMEEALGPEQCQEMRYFFHCLVIYGGMARGRANVAQFINEYRKLNRQGQIRRERF